MTAVIVTGAPQGSPQWLAARRGGITGTDIGALLGHNPWRTPLDVYLSKQVGHIPDEPGEPALWGARLEPLVRDHYASQHPGSIVEEVPGLLAHPAQPVLRGSLDGLAHDRSGSVVLEVKTTRQRWADDYLPDHYLTQALWYLGICGLDACHVAVLTAGQSYSERVIAAEPEWFDSAAEFALGWWDRHVVAGVMPDPDPIRDAPKLPRLWTPEPGLAVDLDPDLVARLRDARARAAAARAEADTLAARVQIAMADATVGMVDDEPAVRWSPVKPRATVDTAAMQADGVYDTYVRWGEPSRRFTVNPREGEQQ